MKKTPCLALIVLLAALVPLLSHCTTAAKKSAAPAATPTATGSGSTPTAADGYSDLDEYDATTVADPIEPVNRGTFWLNHQLYTYLFRPISNGYKAVVPKLVRKSLDNVFDNARYPIRVTNDLLQGKPERAGQETAKFFVNTTYGLGGLGRPSDRTPGLEDVPSEDTGQTFAVWGIGNGPYFVIPILGPSTVRDTVGLVGDYGLNPLTYVSFIWPAAWLVVVPTTNTVRSLPGQLDAYDAATGDALDRYLSARSAYIQYRKEAAAR
jgi:phospholipid-binding lipoprotein MlaA